MIDIRLFGVGILVGVDRFGVTVIVSRDGWMYEFAPDRWGRVR